MSRRRAEPGATTQIAAAQAAADGAADLLVSGALVTALKPAIGTEPAGFFGRRRRLARPCS